MKIIADWGCAMPAERPNYHAYLLRLWRDGELAPWRASLEAPSPAEIHTFRDLQALFVFLLEQTDQAPPQHSGVDDADA
jgi:hypothetical protein